MAPQLIPAEKKGNLIKPLQTLPSGGNIYILWISAKDFFEKPRHASSAKEIRKDFEKTGKYNKAFLNSLERGLKKSSLFKKTA